MRFTIVMLILFLAGCKASDSSTLVDAIFRGDVESVGKLLRKGVDPNQMSSDGFIPIMIASGSSNVVSDLYADKTTTRLIENSAILESLLKNGANPNYQDKNGRTPLLTTVYHGRLKSVSLLMEHGADPNIVSESGLTPLMYAGKHCISDVARVLIKGGADFRAKSKSGKTAHDIAIEEKCENLGAYKFDS